jgi:hypothetical protein
MALLILAGCNDYRVRFLYPKEQGINQFTERPAVSLYVSEPEDLRPAVEREGRGKIQTLHFPADDKLDQPATMIVRIALMQDLLQTRVASLVQNPQNADYLLTSQLLSMTTQLKRPAAAWMFPLATGVVAGMIGGAGTDVSHGVKVGLVGAFLGTFIPAPADAKATVEVRLELRDRITDEVVWSTTCNGDYAKTIRLSLSAREDKRIAEEFMPKALKKANACAVGQLFAFFQDHDITPPVGR